MYTKLLDLKKNIQLPKTSLDVSKSMKQKASVAREKPCMRLTVATFHCAPGKKEKSKVHS